jgi:hypothetical protein
MTNGNLVMIMVVVCKKTNKPWTFNKIAIYMEKT